MKRLFKLLLIILVSFNLFSCAQKNLVVSDNYKPLEVVSVSDKLKDLYASKSLGFKSVKNARSLGGYITKDGKKVKEKLLIRSAHLGKLSDDEMAILKDEYNLKEIVDFRTKAEIGHAVNRDIKGVNYQKINIIDEVGENDPVLANLKEITGDNSADMMVSYYQNLGTIDDMYEGIVDSAISHRGYRQFFDVLLKNDGATLFHCSSGKDRTGFAAVFILSALGVDRETILDDYEASNVFYENSMNNIVEPLKKNNFTEDDIIEISRLVGIDRAAMEKALVSIDEIYGGMDQYLHNQIGLTSEEIKTLKRKYLE